MKETYKAIFAAVGACLLLICMPAADSKAGEGRGFYSVTELMGKTIKNTQGMEIGDIEDILLARSGKVEYLIMDHGGVMGWGAKKIPIPWQLIEDKIGKGEDFIVVNIDAKRLADAPEFPWSPREEFDELEFREQVKRYYGE